MVLYAQEGHAIEAVLSGVGSSTPSVSGSTSISAKSSNDTVVITGQPSGISTVTVGKTIVLVADKHTALSFWNVHVGANKYDRAPDVPSVLVVGPYLVRDATLKGSHLALRGDLNVTTTLDVIAPSSVNRITWNGAPVSVKKTDIGTLRGTLKFGVEAPTLPNLKEASWSCTDSLPEIQPGFDDSQWVTMNKTSTARPYLPQGGKVRTFSFVVMIRTEHNLSISLCCTPMNTASTKETLSLVATSPVRTLPVYDSAYKGKYNRLLLLSCFY